MRIIGPPSVDKEAVVTKLLNWYETGRCNIRFLHEMFPELWDNALEYKIDPVGIIAQSYKETNGGRFTGVLTPEFYNTGGIKIRNVGFLPGTEDGKALSHQMFPNWEVGALAHIQHVSAYAYWNHTEPVEPMIVDPRYYFVWGQHKCENWSDLGTRWAPAARYGWEIEALMMELKAG